MLETAQKAHARTTKVKTYVEQSNGKSLQTKGQTIISVYWLLYNLRAVLLKRIYLFVKTVYPPPQQRGILSAHALDRINDAILICRACDGGLFGWSSTLLGDIMERDERKLNAYIHWWRSGYLWGFVRLPVKIFMRSNCPKTAKKWANQRDLN